MVLSDYATTGDGLIAALQVLAVSVETKKPASEICQVFQPFPQLLKNVRYSGANPLSSPELATAKAWAEERLAGRGRLVLRASGTEPLIRVMAEAEDDALVLQVVDHVCEAIRAITEA